MAVSTRPDSFELSYYLGVLRRRWRIVLVVACAGLLLAGADAELTSKTYTGVVLVQVNPLPNNANQATGRTNGDVNMDNEAQIAGSVAVATLAEARLHSPLTAQELVKRISVTVPANTTFLQISCSAGSAARAAQCANDFGAAFLSNRLGSAVTAVVQARTGLQAKFNSLLKQIQTIKEQLAKLPAKSLARTAPQLTLNADELLIGAVGTEVNQSVTAIADLTPAAVGSIPTPASPPAAPSSPRLKLLLPSGLLLGLLIGLLLAFYVDRRDARIHTSSEVERFLDLPVLLDASQERAGLHSALASPRSKAGRAFAELAQYVAGSLGDEDRVLVVVGTAAGTGSSVIAANLAASLARTRSEVVLVCAGVRGRLTAQLFGIGDGPGLSEVLAGTASVREVTRTPAEMSRLSVIRPGVDASGSMLYPQYETSQRVMAELRGGTGYVIIEVESVGVDADTLTLSEFADGALLVVEIAGTRRPDALACAQRLHRMHVPVLGAAILPARTSRVANRPEPASAAGWGGQAAQARRTVQAAPFEPGGHSFQPLVGDAGSIPTAFGNDPPEQRPPPNPDPWTALLDTVQERDNGVALHPSGDRQPQWPLAPEAPWRDEPPT
jgi:capsular polysaccharide biosynthesis protein/MinD-like ATPase involved in chromosome partitioning or flagellar assembly